MRKTKNSLITSIIAIVLCFSMLAGSTFAWFTDSVTSSGNVIQTGRLEAEMYWSKQLLDADSDEWIDASTGAIFTHDNWEPGYTEIRYIKVKNGGTVNFKWQLTLEANGEVSALSDAIDVYYVNPVSNAITSLEGLTSAGVLTDVLANKYSSTGHLVPDQNVILAIVFHMDELAGNEYQDTTLCEEGFSLKLLATQGIGDSDDIGDDYDKDAEGEDTVINFSASASLSNVPLLHGALVNELTIGSNSGINATLPADVMIADGATSLDLSVSKADNGNNITVGEGALARSLDVHISGIAANNTVPMIVNLGAIMNKGLSDTEVKLYHIENGTPVLMTKVDSAADFAIHNQFTYDAATGEVSIFVASFSVFSAIQTSADVWDGKAVAEGFGSGTGTEANPYIIETAAQLVYFRNQVDAGVTYEGQFVKLNKDIDLDKKLFDPIGYGYVSNGGQAFMGIFDGGNHTIYNLYQNGWELGYSYSTAGGGLFASIENATIKNLAISGANIVMECIDMGTVVGYAQGNCTFENIVVTNSKLANYQRYTGGVVGEVCKGDMKAEYTHIFKNVTVDSSVKLSSLWGDFDNACGGVIGGKWGDAKVLMENVIVAAELDVFSDVTAAYQWYAYRRCGMLIGHTEQNSPKQALNAAADFLTCENVHVYYGDWVNYTYYQFADQDSTTGQRYPWVRAEKGEHNDAFSNPRYGVPTYGGVKVTDGSKATASANITFGQLYGGGQGVYGCNEHNGVNIHSIGETKTVYIQNNLDWKNLKLQYWYANGEDTWTTNIDGIDMSSMETAVDNVYKIKLPAYIDGFKITADDAKEKAFNFIDVTDGQTYNLDGEALYEASVNGMPYENLADAIKNANGGTVFLIDDVDLPGVIVIEGKVTLDLNGKTIKATELDQEGKRIEALLVKGENAEVIIRGNGTMLATGDADYVEVISAIDGAKVTIENGTFISDGCTAIYATRGAIASIYDGYFEAKEKYDGRYFTLDVNEIEGTRGTIVVYGGTYKNFDPANHSIDGKNYTNKLPNDCYSSIKNEAEKTFTVESNHNFIDNECKCGASKVTKWELVTDASELKTGDKIVLVAKDSNYALSTNQKDKNRDGVEITKQDNSIVINDNVQIIVLEKGTADETFAFNVGNGYLYAASSSANNLKTQKTNNENGLWAITITDGIASIVATASSNRNVMQYNPNNGSPLFSCYASASQKDIAIYKLSANDVIIEAHECERFANGETCVQDAICTLCGKTVLDTALGHSYESVINEATCTKNGYIIHTCSICDDKYVSDVTEALGHSFVNETCSVCGESKPQAGGTKTYTFNSYTAGTQYANNEEHKLDENTIIVTTNCHFTSELRIYSSSAHNGYAIIKSTVPITTIQLNAGDNSDELLIYGSNDEGETWTEVAVISVTSTSYKDYTADLNAAYKWLKLDVKGSNQIRLKSITLTTADTENEGGSSEPACPHINTTTTTTAKCTQSGTETVTCVDCGEKVSETQVDALGHTTENGVCDNCGETIGGSTTPVVKTLATFELGANGSATHKDGSTAKTTYSETVDGYTLSITGGDKMYPGSIDAKGNSCIKFGTGSVAGKCTIAVPENVTEVVIYVAKYKTNTATLSVNGTTYTLTKNSNDGAYDVITIDTTSTKTISFTTVSGGYRCMINTIVFNGYAE